MNSLTFTLYYSYCLSEWMTGCCPNKQDLAASSPTPAIAIHLPGHRPAGLSSPGCCCLAAAYFVTVCMASARRPTLLVFTPAMLMRPFLQPVTQQHHAHSSTWAAHLSRSDQSAVSQSCRQCATAASYSEHGLRGVCCCRQLQSSSVAGIVLLLPATVKQ
jgi:hypothetical protein